MDNAGVKKLAMNLLELVERTEYRLVQVNGQRRYGGPPPNWEGPPPPIGSEIFVGKIPRNCFEDELVPVFETVGDIYELRLMMDFSGSNRGFGFVMYSSPEIADLAVEKLNNYEIRTGQRIGVVKSVNNCRLFMWGFPSNKSEEDIKSALSPITEGITEVWFPKKRKSGTKSHSLNSSVRYAFVEYVSHRTAALARRRLIPSRVELWGKRIIVDWAARGPCRKTSKEDSSEAKVRINQENIPTSPAITQCDSNNVQHVIDRGTVSSHSSSTWSLEQMMDNFITGNSCTDSGLLLMKDPLEPLKTGLSNANSILDDANSAILKPNSSTSETFSAVDANGAVGGPGTETVSRFENGDMRTHEIEMGRNPRVYHLYQGNRVNGDAFDPGEKFDYSVDLLKSQIRNYSDGDYRPQKQRYLRGATHTPILFSGDIKSNEHVEGTQLSLQERADQPELFCDQILGTFNRLKVGTAIKESTAGLNNIPTTGSIETEFTLPWNQSSVAQKFLQDSKFDENLTSTSVTGGTNMWAGGNEASSFGKCRPGMKFCHAADDVAVNMCNATTREGKQNDTVGLESLPTLDSGSAVFMNSNKLDKSLASFEGEQEILPKSGVGSILPATLCRSDVFCTNAAVGIQNHSSNFNQAPGSPVYKSLASFEGEQEILPKSNVGSILAAPLRKSDVFCTNAAVGIQNHSSNFNRAPGSPVYIGGRYSSVSQPSKVLEAPPFMNSF